jgi:hypothetical protein
MTDSFRSSQKPPVWQTASLPNWRFGKLVVPHLIVNAGWRGSMLPRILHIHPDTLSTGEFFNAITN